MLHKYIIMISFIIYVTSYKLIKNKIKMFFSLSQRIHLIPILLLNIPSLFFTLIIIQNLFGIPALSYI